MVVTTTKRARELRNNATDAERKLWAQLRADQLGVRFRRQFPIGNYFADFACPAWKLIIEVDGGQHGMLIEYDDRRTIWLQNLGYTVLRFWNDEVMGDIEGVISKIRGQLNHPPLPDPLPHFMGEREK